MGRHKEWRKIAKKLRRKNIRQSAARKRCEILVEEQRKIESSPSYQQRCREQDLIDKFQEEEELRLKKLEEEQWIQREKESQRLWLELQEKIAKSRSEKARQEQLIRDEWQREQKKLAEKKKQIEDEENLKRQKEELIQKKLEEFLSYEGPMPEEINISIETNPGKPVCPFFQKTGACRFKDFCSRNHVRPGISCVLLIIGFYSHFGMQHFNHEEYSSDVLLEYDDYDTYSHFREFFSDVLPEFCKFGTVIQFKVCYNYEPHLRGNVYVEYEDVRDAIKAYKTFHGRWYGGKQLHVEFVNIPSWKQAICGLFFKQRCPKGNSCNFLHVFRNPNGKFSEADRDLFRRKEVAESTSMMSSFRWSESPEPRDLSNNDKANNKDDNICPNSKRNKESDKSKKSSKRSKDKKVNLESRSSSSSSTSNSKKLHNRDDHKYKRSSQSEKDLSEEIENFNSKDINVKQNRHRCSHRKEHSRRKNK